MKIELHLSAYDTSFDRSTCDEQSNAIMLTGLGTQTGKDRKNPRQVEGCLKIGLWDHSLPTLNRVAKTDSS